MLKVVNLSKQYSGVWALDKINIGFDKGHVYSLVGPNGAGKTTLSAIISNIILPDSGEMIWAPTYDSKDVFFMLSGDRNLYWKNTVLENIDYFCAIKGVRKSKDAITKLIEDMSEYIPDLKNHLKKPVQKLSFGQKRIVSLMIPIICNSRFIILDEVSEGLDIDTKSIFAQILKKVKQDKVILTTSHDVSFVEESSDKIIFINKGKVIDVIENDTEIDLKNEYRLRMEGVS